MIDSSLSCLFFLGCSFFLFFSLPGILLLLLLLFGLCLLLDLVKFGLLFVDFFLSPILVRLLSLLDQLKLLLLSLVLLIFLILLIGLFRLVGPLIDVVELGLFELLQLGIFVFGHFVHLFACFDGFLVAVQFSFLVVLGCLVDPGFFFLLLLL